MIYLPDSKMDINKFVDVNLPTKKQIFGRLGATATGQYYSGDDSVRMSMTPTEKADALVSAAENYEPEKPSDDGAAD